MFDNNNSSALADQRLEHAQKCLDIQRVKADGRLVENENRVGLGLSHFAGQLQPLGFPSGETGSLFSQSQIAKAQILKDLKTLMDGFQIFTGFQGLGNVHGHELRQGIGGPGFIYIPDQPGFFGVSGASALGTGNLHIRKKLHVQADYPGAVADRAAESSGVIGESPCLPAFLFGCGSFCKSFPQFVMDVGIGSYCGADVDADRSGVD